MRHFLVPCLLAVLLAGCISDFLSFGNESEADSLTIVNAADRPFAVVVSDAESRHLIDLIGAFSAEEFEERKIDVGASAVIEKTGYEKGKDAYLVLYAQCDCALPEWIANTAGPDAAVLVKDFEVSAKVLTLMNYRVVIKDL